MPGLTPEQREVATHAGGPLLVVGAAGTGKTRALEARVALLVEAGEPADAILALVSTEAAADTLRARLEAAIERPYEELVVTTVHGLAARILRDGGHAAGIDPLAAVVTPADRLALLLERIDQLTLREHDTRGRPAALLAAVVGRIDRLEEEGVTAEDHARWARSLPDGEEEGERSRAAREREFARLWSDHNRMLGETGALSAGDAVRRALQVLSAAPALRARYRHLLVDDLQDLNHQPLELLRALGAGARSVVAFGDDDQAVRRFRGAATKNLHDFAERFAGARTIHLVRGLRCGARIHAAAHAVVAPGADRIEKAVEAPDGGEVAFWRCANERAQAQSVAAEIEHLVMGKGIAPERIAVLVRSVRSEGQAIAVALEEHAVPHAVLGAAAFFQRAEVRDVIAWLRLLADPHDAGAVVRALARPPVELRSADIARCTQIARRRKLDMISGLAAATESPQVPPEARERVHGFLRRYRAAAAELDSARPDLFVHRLIEGLGLRRQLLFAATPEGVERLASLSRLAELAAGHVRRAPQATARDFAVQVAAVAEAGLYDEEDAGDVRSGGVQVLTMSAAAGREWDHVFIVGLHAARMPGARQRPVEPIPDELLREPLPPSTRSQHIAEMRRLLHVAMTRARTRLVLAYPERGAAGAAQPPSPFAEEARAAAGGEWEAREEELFGPDEALHATFRILREELLEQVSTVGSRLGELRFDTDLDVSHAVVRYLELIKLAALIDRAPESGPADTLPEINARLLQAVSPEQREVFLSSPLDEFLVDAERAAGRRAQALAKRQEPSLEPFLPKRGDGLVLSASDIDTYRTCPLRYKFARVFRIPQEPTINQRFGIVVHQVLERYHAQEGAGLSELLGLLDASWRRSGFGESNDEERQLRAKAVAALTRYHERNLAEPSDPVWFERQFAFHMGPHLLRGRVDRVDRLPDGSYELIDYKTGPAKTPAQLADDVQLSLYAIGAREAWELESAAQSYWYVLDDAKVPVRRDDSHREWLMDTVMEVADGILGQGFEPTPSFAACSACDFRIACPAAEV